MMNILYVIATSQSLARFLALLGIFALPSYAFAIGNFKPSQQELSTLPEYCAPRAESWGNDFKHPVVARWVAVFGKDWIHLHHYCRALLLEKKSYKTSNRKIKKSLLIQSIKEIEYMEGNVTSNFPLWVEMTIRKGGVYKGLKEYSKAAATFQKAISLSPSLAKPYCALFDVYMKMGATDSAVNILGVGLDNATKGRCLVRREKRMRQHD